MIDYKTQKKNNILREIKIIWNSNCSVQKYGFIGTYPGSFIYILSVAAFTLQWQNWIVATETIWPDKA
jgi:hypothetical protein